MEVILKQNVKDMSQEYLRQAAISVLNSKDTKSFLMLAMSKEEACCAVHVSMAISGAELLKCMIHLFHSKPETKEAARLALKILSDWGYEKALETVEMVELKAEIERKEK